MIKGYVTLAGAGSGDPELITLKALKALQKADIILTDRLVSPFLIEKEARKDAQIIYVGKQCSKGIHTPQEEINLLMVEYALQGKQVLRLKGGDASLFSNILDELKILKKNDIPYQIIPGVSAAFGAAAYSAIPLTARNHSRGVRFLTLYNLNHITQKEWTDWAETKDTLVFYMSGLKLEKLTNQFLKNGIDTSKGIAIIQQATTPEQKTTVFFFEELKYKTLPEFEHVPTLIIVGKVVNLHHEFAWLEEKQTPFPASSFVESYFDNHKNTYKYAV
ncbi:uroporphyrinogen-III C-methyltransferase [Bernardetia sp. MNP-M8]|uniref:uroporphyrinogen-III C-methyltransferase n=1 Tax=Bernardetia sp. MNP-M8 TaxID=3127470 RepID=UPI0030CE7D57